MININEVLKEYRNLSGLSLDDLQKRSGIPKSTLSRYENNPNQKIDIKAFFEIAKVLQIPASVIEGIWIDEDSVPGEKEIKLSVLGKVCAGNGIYAEQNVIGTETADSRYANGEYFYLSVTGNSMSPHINNGDLVLVKRQSMVDSGDVAVVMVDREEGMLKKVVIKKDCIRLLSFNPYYPEMTFEKNEINRVDIVGKVIESKRKW